MVPARKFIAVLLAVLMLVAVSGCSKGKGKKDAIKDGDSGIVQGESDVKDGATVPAFNPAPLQDPDEIAALDALTTNLPDPRPEKGTPLEVELRRWTPSIKTSSVRLLDASVAWQALKDTPTVETTDAAVNACLDVDSSIDTLAAVLNNVSESGLKEGTTLKEFGLTPLIILKGYTGVDSGDLSCKGFMRYYGTLAVDDIDVSELEFTMDYFIAVADNVGEFYDSLAKA